MYQKLRELWLSTTLKHKLSLYTAMVILIMASSAVFNVWVMDFTLDGFDKILSDNSRCNDFQQAMELEIDAFESYVRERRNGASVLFHFSTAASEKSGMQERGI